MVGCVFLSQNWAPLVKKIYKWLAAFFFFVPKLGTTRDTKNSQKNLQMVGCVFLSQKLGTTCWKNLQMVGCVFLSQKLGTTGWKNLQMVGCVFLSQNWAPLVKKNLQMVGCVFLSQNWAPLVKKRFFTFFLAKKKIIVCTWIGKLPNKNF